MRRLLLDEMVSPRIAEQLGDEHDVLALSANPAWRGLPDADVLALAAGQQRILVTDNIKDFAVLDAQWAAQGRTHPGMLFISAKAFPSNRAKNGRIISALTARFAENRWPEPGLCAFL